MSEVPTNIRITAEGVAALAATEREIDLLIMEIDAYEERARTLAVELASCTDKKKLTTLELAVEDNRRERIVKLNRLESVKEARLEQNKIWAKKAVREIPPELVPLRRQFIERLDEYVRTKYGRGEIRITRSLATQFDEIAQVSARFYELFDVYCQARVVLGENEYDPSIVTLPRVRELGDFREFDQRFDVVTGTLQPGLDNGRVLHWIGRFHGRIVEGILSQKDIERRQGDAKRIHDDVLHVPPPDPVVAEVFAQIEENRRKYESLSPIERIQMGDPKMSDFLYVLKSRSDTRTPAEALGGPL